MARTKRAAALLVAFLVLAGCSGKGEDDGPTTTPTATGTASPTPTMGSGASGTVAVTLNRTTPDGGVPLTVNFTLDATFRSANGTKVPPPTGASWTVAVVAEAAGNATGNATGGAAGPTGSTLPANVTLTLNETGNFTVVATVGAPGFAPGNDSFIVAAFPGGGAGGAPLFFEGGETDGSQWTLTSNILLTNTAPMVPETEVPEDHPAGPWAVTDAVARSGTHAWGTPYPDNYRSRMTSVPVAIPAAGATLSYWVIGGAEANNFDGLFVLAGPDGALEQLAYHAGAIAEWTEFTVDLSPFAGQEVLLQFRLDSDLSCSNDGPPAGGGNLCGEGFDGGGLSVDDITVA